jgi:hypothetical protein
MALLVLVKNESIYFYIISLSTDGVDNKLVGSTADSAEENS